MANRACKEIELLSGCGEFCGRCPNYLGEKQPKCLGCNAVKGHVFWANGVCETYACMASHGVNHCGVCEEFPSDQLINHYDPNNPEGQRNAVLRAGVLAYRAKHGDEKTLTLLKKLGKPPRT